MPALAAVALVLATAFPSASTISWMRPEAFRLSVGMKRDQALQRLRERGLESKKGKIVGEVVVPYDEGKTVTLQFRAARLQSLRFELVGFIPKIRQGFREEIELLEKKEGRKRSASTSKSIVIFEERAPHIMVVTSTEAPTGFGKQGIAYLVVRYFEPPSR